MAQALNSSTGGGGEQRHLDLWEFDAGIVSPEQPGLGRDPVSREERKEGRKERGKGGMGG